MIRTAYVTGADRGLGLALAAELLHRGFTVFAGSYMPEWHELASLKKLHPDKLRVLTLDVTSDDSVAAAASAIEALTPSLDVLINNAAIFLDRSGNVLEPMYFEDMQRIHDVNALGPLRVNHSVMPLVLRGSMKKVVYISSEAGRISQNFRISEYAYTMSKASVNMQATIVQRHLKPEGVKVLAIHPGYVRSYMLGHLNEEATVEPSESAAYIVNLIETQTDPDGPIYMDYKGNVMHW